MAVRTHIAFLEFVTQYGGAPRSTVEFAARLAQHEKVSIIDPYGSCEEFAQAVREAGLDYHVLSPGRRDVVIGGQGRLLRRVGCLTSALPGLLTVRSRAVHAVRRIGATVVCGNNPKSLMMIAASYALRHLPLTGYLRGWYTPDMLPPYAHWLYRTRCSRLFAVSYQTRAALCCQGFDPERIVVMHNPIDVECVLARSQRPLVSALPGCDRPVRILLPAALLATKGQHTAIRSLRHIVEAGHDATLWLAGDTGPGQTAEYVHHLRRMAQTLGVLDRVHWLGLRPDLPQIMKAATVVILPTHSEGLPRVIMEAMSLGRPVAATPVGGVLDLILPGVTGLLFEVGDAAGLAACISWVMACPEQADQLRFAAQRFVRCNFRPEDQTRKALAIFRNLSENGRLGVLKP